MSLRFLHGNSLIGRIWKTEGIYPDVCLTDEELFKVQEEDTIIDAAGVQLVVDRCTICDGPILHSKDGEKQSLCQIHA